jgi:hypothetical protein
VLCFAARHVDRCARERGDCAAGSFVSATFEHCASHTRWTNQKQTKNHIILVSSRRCLIHMGRLMGTQKLGYINPWSLRSLMCRTRMPRHKLCLSPVCMNPWSLRSLMCRTRMPRHKLCLYQLSLALDLSFFRFKHVCEFGGGSICES